MKTTIDCAGRTVGAGAPAFLIAEMCANHDKDLAQALRLIDIAAAAGMDAVKLQTYTADSLTLPTRHASARIDPVWGAETLYELYRQAAMPMAFHAPIYERARERGLIVFTSVYDPRDLDFLEKLGTPVYKIASFELVHFPLLRAVAQTGKPLILSTGMASLAEVGEALDVLDGAGAREVAVLHCCSAYPAPVDSVNLAAIDAMYRAFGVPVGFSDHTLGSHIALAAVMRGACIVEKHFTNDPRRPGPDHRFSLDAHGLGEMVRCIREAEVAVGTGYKRLTACEAENKAVGRRSLFVAVDIPAGGRIEAPMLRIVRPGSGLHPRYWNWVLGREAKRAIAAGSPLTWDDL